MIVNLTFMKSPPQKIKKLPKIAKDAVNWAMMIFGEYHTAFTKYIEDFKSFHTLYLSTLSIQVLYLS